MKDFLSRLEPKRFPVVGRVREALAMKLGYPSHGLRITVRLQDTVVAQRVVWAPPVGSLLSGSATLVLLSLLLSLSAGAGLDFLGLLSPFVSQLLLVVLTPAALAMAVAALAWPREQVIGSTGADAVPTSDGQALASVRWSPGASPVLVLAGGSEGSRSMEPGDVWTWRSGEVAVDILAQEREVARRLPLDPLGDIALVVVILTLYVGMAQARLFIGMAPQTAAAPPSHSMSPELIARLLEKDLDGEEEGWTQPTDRPEHERQNPGVYMPAGNTGPMTRAGGGSEQGEDPIRGPQPEDQEPAADPALADEPDDAALALASPPETPQELELPDASEPASLAETELEQQANEPSRPLDPVERFIGWGFKDWLDASPQREKLDPRVERHLMLARARLRLDPDDYGALQMVGHYAYLAENAELSQATFRRLTEKYPEDSAGYNNLALTYKRTQEWTQEEALYRKALQLEPDDPVVLNNLAVNLAHQGRFDEALGLMALLEEIDPDDPYSDLHRAKVYAAMGRKDRAFKYLKRALDGVERLDTLHHIEFRQDLRLEPLLAELRTEPRYERLLYKIYGSEAEALLKPAQGRGRG